MRGFATRTALLATALIAFVSALNAGQALATHVACGDTITQDTTLDSDLIDCPGNGIIIGADNITLDLGGHLVDGDDDGESGGVGVGSLFSIDGRHGVVIKNGQLREFAYGVQLLDVSGSRIEDLRVSGNHNAGIEVGGRQNLIRRNSVSDSGRGLWFDSIGRSRVEHNDVFGNPIGIHFDGGSSRNLIRGNAISSNFGYGMLIVDANENRIVGNAVLNNGREAYSGIGVGQGVRLASAHRNVFEQNLLSGNDTGISLEEESINNRIKNNSASGNAVDGIFVYAEYSTDNQIVGNSANENGDDGIDLDSPGNNVARNRANDNGDLGIEAVAGTIDGGGNRAFGNGNPLQCLNVVCK